MKNSECLYEKFKEFGVTQKMTQVVAEEMKGSTLKEMSDVLYILFQHKFQSKNIDKMMQDGVPIDLIQKLLPYLEHSRQETVEVRKEHIGEQADYLNCFIKSVYPVIEKRIEELRDKIPSTDKWRFIQMYRLMEGQLEILLVYGSIYDKTGAVSKNITAYKKDVQQINKLFFKKFEEESSTM